MIQFKCIAHDDSEEGYWSSRKQERKLEKKESPNEIKYHQKCF